MKLAISNMVNVLTHAVRKFASARCLHDRNVENGNVLVSRSDGKLTPLVLRSASLHDDLKTEAVRVNVAVDMMNYILPITDKDNYADLVLWWKQSAQLYADLREKQLLGASLFAVTPNLNIHGIVYNEDIPLFKL